MSKSIRRYYPTGLALARAGVSWCDTEEYISQFQNPDEADAVATYNGQVPQGTGSSSIIRLNFANDLTDLPNAYTVAKL